MYKKPAGVVLVFLVTTAIIYFGFSALNYETFKFDIRVVAAASAMGSVITVLIVKPPFDSAKNKKAQQVS